MVFLDVEPDEKVGLVNPDGAPDDGDSALLLYDCGATSSGRGSNQFQPWARHGLHSASHTTRPGRSLPNGRVSRLPDGEGLD
jgi:hypothetical protein